MAQEQPEASHVEIVSWTGRNLLFIRQLKEPPMNVRSLVLALLVAMTATGVHAEDYKAGTLQISNPWIRHLDGRHSR
jgi:hypothetical protein